MIITESHPENGSRIKGSVLVVDDNLDNLRLLVGMLTEKGYKVRPASSGSLALKSVQSILPDLILLDIKMPGMDGFEVCRHLKADEKTRDVPVLFISAMAEMEDKIEGFGVGAVDYITKPFQHEEVLARVETHVSLSRMHQQLEQMVKVRTRELTMANEQLKQEIKDRKMAEAREKHLNMILQAIRNINQLIVQEKDRDQLLEKACAILLETRFYCHAWIVLTDESGTLTTTAQASIGESFSTLIRQIEHDNPPYCIRKAMEQPDILYIKHTDSICAGCPFPDECRDSGSAIVRLEHGGKNFGFLNISFPMELVLDEEEKSLIIELAGDIAFALYGYAQEKRKDQAEKALRENEKRFRELADSLPQVVFEIDTTGLVTFVNQNAFDIFGYTQSDFDKGLNGFEMLIPEDRDRALNNMLKDFSGNKLESIEYTALRKNGTTFPVIIHSSVVRQNNKVIGLRGIIIDLTDQKKMEADLTRRAMAMEHSSDTIVITDTNGTITYVNPAFEKITGYARKEAVGQNPRILQSGKHDEAFYRYLWQTISGGKTWSGRLINKKKDGSHYTEESTISPVFSPSGEIINYVAVKRDITDKINLENQFRQAQKMEAIGTLAGGIAHDFNNILFPIIACAEMSVDDVPEDSIARKNLNEIIKGSLRARDLVQQILTFSRQQDQELKPLKVQIVIREALKLIRSSLPSTIGINHNIDKDCGLVIADPTQIHQIVMNLCTNAYHAIDDIGGTLEVTLNEVELAVDDLTGQDLEPGPYLCLKVGDTGHGMDQAVMDRIFDPYFTTKEMGKGTGLGLAVVHGIVKNYKGYIRVDSEPGKGTIFHVYLPVIKDLPETADVEACISVQRGDERILLVDDNKDIVDIEQKMLERLGYHVTARTGSIEAIEAFRANPDSFDLVITDMTMPNMTGDKLSAEVMKIRSDIPVIICTGFSERMSEKKAKSLGIKAFLMKPIVISVLAKTIRMILDPALSEK